MCIKLHRCIYAKIKSNEDKITYVTNSATNASLISKRG